MFLPEGDRYSYTKEYLEDKLASLFGGRIAEAIIFGANKVTTGASNDIQKATEIARNMVTKWGLSEKIGPLSVGSANDEEVFLGHSITRHKDISEATSSIVDAEVRNIIDRSYERAEKILTEKRHILDDMAKALMTYETINQDQIQDLMHGRPVREPPNWRANQKDAKKKADAVSEEQPTQAELKLDPSDTNETSATETTTGT
jgi:cell division protease FtsH